MKIIGTSGKAYTGLGSLLWEFLLHRGYLAHHANQNIPGPINAPLRAEQLAAILKRLQAPMSAFFSLAHQAPPRA